MKRLFLGLLSILTLILINSTPTFAGANDFYFSSAIFDYYLEKSPDGTSTMRVEEELTAVFPTTNQNHGIERCIPKQYRGVDSLVASSFSVTRNDIKEPFSSSTNAGELCFRIGSSSSYVHGTQVYNISYTFNNVILEPENSNFQELYWDTNGTGWSQNFNTISATVHLGDSVAPAFTGNTSCYVGNYGSKGLDRCRTISAGSTVTFSAENLTARENLTIDLEFSPNSFAVTKPKPNYILYALLGLEAILFFASIFIWVKCSSSVSEKRALAKSPKPVQYTPPKNLTIAEAGQIWLKSAPSLQVATLMELAVSHKIELIKGKKKTFGGYKWEVHIKNLDNVSEEQRIVLEILNAGSTVNVGDKIEIKSHTATSHLQSLGRQYTSKPEALLRTKKLLEPKNHKNPAFSRVGLFIFFYCLVAIFTAIYIVNFAPENDLNYSLNILTFFVSGISLIVYIAIASIIRSNARKFNSRTYEGIKMSNYIDGLKEYMELAEADRIKFLHSVKTADISNEGIVKLYEKLLPYAILFGIEESWLSELSKYYKLDDVTDPTWIVGATHFTWRDFRTFSTYTRSSVSSSTAVQSSSSSGFSGGGGGGFSGGGGGGGGGGGW